MKSRIISTVVLSVSFLVLITTGILLYSIPYENFISSLHVWASLLLILSIGVHFYNNWTVYKRHIGTSTGKLMLILTIFGVLPVSYGLLTDLAPFSSVIHFGEKLRSSTTVKDGEFTIIDFTQNNNDSPLEVFVKTGAHYTSEEKELFLGFTYTSIPQMVIWLETPEGEFVKTLYLTSKTSSSTFRSKDLSREEPVRRPEALPYWGHRRGKMATDGLFIPDFGSLELDGVTAATPIGDHHLIMPKHSNGKYKLMLEINRSYDFNEFYSHDRFPNDEVYSGSGSSGQPSLIYQADIDLNIAGETLFELQGHGHHSGKTGDIYKNLKNITTAKQLLTFIVAKVNNT